MKFPKTAAQEAANAKLRINPPAWVLFAAPPTNAFASTTDFENSKASFKGHITDLRTRAKMLRDEKDRELIQEDDQKNKQPYWLEVVHND